MTELIRMEHIDKFYGRVQALDDVTVRVNEREIVGLLGDNGAGKSTLIKVLSGAVPMTRGDIFIRGRKVNIRSTTDAIDLGIETIYQDSALVTQLSIARNLFLGREPIKGPRFLNRMDKAAMNAVATDLLAEVGLSKNIPPTTPIGSLSGGERQAVAIARAMHFDSELIVLDEPTNNLGVAETQGVLRFVRNARELGPFLHLHRPQHPSRVPGGRSHHRPAPGQGGRRRHRPPAVQHRRGRAGDHRPGRTWRAEHRGVGPFCPGSGVIPRVTAGSCGLRGSGVRADRPLRQPPPGSVGDAVQVPSRGGWDTSRGRVVLVLAASANVAHRDGIEWRHPMTVLVRLARARNESPTQDSIDEAQNGVRPDTGPEELQGVRHDLLHRWDWR